MTDDAKRFPQWMRFLIWIAVILTVTPILALVFMFVGGVVFMLVAR